jgi:hypothetical protein
LHLEIFALRHHLGVLQRLVKKPKLTPADRLIWAWLSELWLDWRSALVIVKPETVIACTVKAFDFPGRGKFVPAELGGRAFRMKFAN